MRTHHVLIRRAGSQYEIVACGEDESIGHYGEIVISEVRDATYALTAGRALSRFCNRTLFIDDSIYMELGGQLRELLKEEHLEEQSLGITVSKY